MAAVLAGGPGAVLSHRSAAALWEMRPTPKGRIEVTVPPDRRGRPGLRFYRTELPQDEKTKHDGIPVTIVARTLVDLAAGMSQGLLERAWPGRDPTPPQRTSPECRNSTTRDQAASQEPHGGTRQAFERDRERDRLLQAAGVAKDLRDLLA